MRASTAKQIGSSSDIFLWVLIYTVTGRTLGRIAGLSDPEHSYSPLLYRPWDPLQMAAQEWMRNAAS